MAHPKRRQSKTRRDKRRTHDVAVVPQIAKIQQLVKTICITAHTGTKVNCTIVGRCLWIVQKKQNRFTSFDFIRL